MEGNKQVPGTKIIVLVRAPQYRVHTRKGRHAKKKRKEYDEGKKRNKIRKIAEKRNENTHALRAPALVLQPI